VSGWLDRLRKRLDQAPKPITFFFRDDDAGWDDEALLWLLDIFGEEPAPLDLAVIPGSADEALATTLLDRRGGAVRRLRFHQHGFRHVNHEATGRKCEFGPSRDRAEQAADIEAGRDRLRGLLGAALDPIFTPPWNRCSQITVDVLTSWDSRRSLVTRPRPRCGSTGSWTCPSRSTGPIGTTHSALESRRWARSWPRRRRGRRWSGSCCITHGWPARIGARSVS
jgi:hypothetical protein